MIVADDDNHRIEKFDPNGVFRGAAGLSGRRAWAVRLPLRRRARRRPATCTSPTTSTIASSSSTPELSFAGAWGGFGVETGPARPSRARSRAIRPATPTWRTPPTTASRCSTRTATTCARSAPPARGPACSRRRAGSRSIRPAGCSSPTRSSNRIEAFAPGSDAFAGAWTTRGGHAAGFNVAERHRHRPARLGVRRRSRATNGSCTSGATARTSSKLGGPADLGGAQLSGAGSVAVAPGDGRRLYVADAGHNRVLVYGPEGTLLAKWGAGGGDGAAGSGPGEFNHPGGRRGRRRGRRVRGRHGQRPRRQALPRRRRARRMGLARHRRRALSRARPASRSTAPGACMCVDSENNRVEVFDADGRFLAKWGLRGAGTGRVLPADRASRSAATATCTWPTPTTTASSASTPSPRRRPAVWRPAAGRRRWTSRRCCDVSLPRRAGVLARRALALAGELQARLQDPRHRHAVAARPARRRCGCSRSPARCRLQLAGHVRLRVAPLGASAPAQGSSAHTDDDGARARSSPPDPPAGERLSRAATR